MKQTAVEWLEIQLFKKQGKFNKSDIDQAKAMEKEQIIRAHLMARCYDNPNSHNEADQYYNQTYKSE